MNLWRIDMWNVISNFFTMVAIAYAFVTFVAFKRTLIYDDDRMGSKEFIWTTLAIVALLMTLKYIVPAIF